MDVRQKTQAKILDIETEMRMIANVRHRPGSKSSMREDGDLVGVSGELAFEQTTNYPMDRTFKPAGDEGIDFETNAGNIDVKTARKARMLFLEQHAKTKADILVLAQYQGTHKLATLLGWETVEEMRKQPVQQFERTNHTKRASLLRPMSSLYERLYPRKIWEWLQLSKMDLDLKVHKGVHYAAPGESAEVKQRGRAADLPAMGDSEALAVLALFREISGCIVNLSRGSFNTPHI